MREHKYMAWVIGQERMVRVAGLNFSDPIQIEVPRIGMEEIEGSAWDDPDNFEFWNEGEEAILLQYTGRKDKNGVEIYESDVVKCYSLEYATALREEMYKAEFIGLVCYEPPSFFIKIKLDDKYPMDKNWIDFSAEAGPYEVICNIYAHPELLEGKDS